MFEHNYALGGAAINVDHYLANLNNVTISNNKESAIQVSYIHTYICIKRSACAHVANTYANYVCIYVCDWV